MGVSLKTGFSFIGIYHKIFEKIEKYMQDWCPLIWFLREILDPDSYIFYSDTFLQIVNEVKVGGDKSDDECLFVEVKDMESSCRRDDNEVCNWI